MLQAWAGLPVRSDAEREAALVLMRLAPATGRGRRGDGRPMRPVGGLADWLALQDAMETWHWVWTNGGADVGRDRGAEGAGEG